MSRKIACLSCDLLIQLPDSVHHKVKLCCPRCQHTLEKGHSNALDYSLAVVLSCLLLLLISYGFDFLSFETRGQFREISLIQTTQELYAKGFFFLAALVSALTLVFPLIYLLLLLRVLVPAKFYQGKNRQIKADKISLLYIVRVVNKLTPWLMVDVFLIGVLVALIKMWSLAAITFGLSFWSFLLFVMFFSYLLYSVDQQKLLRWTGNVG